MKRVGKFMVFVLLWACVGCASKVKVVDEEAFKSLEAVKKKDELYYQGYRDGVEWCNKEWFMRLQSELEDLKRQKLWSKYVKGGYVKPPLIAEIYIPSKISEDGKTFTSGSIEYVIVEDAKFVSENLLQRLSQKRPLVFLGIYFTNESLNEKKAEIKSYLRQKGWDKEASVEVMMTVSGKGKALLVHVKDFKKAEILANDLGGEIVL